MERNEELALTLVEIEAAAEVEGGEASAKNPALGGSEELQQVTRLLAGMQIGRGGRDGRRPKPRDRMQSWMCRPN